MKRLLIPLLCSFSILLFGQNEADKRTCFTKKISGVNTNIDIDGLIDEEIWNSVEWNSDFTVHFPNNGEKPKRETKFKVLYDDDFIYVAFRCYHENVEELENRLGRRDNFPGDWVEVNIDSYYDKSTAFSFTTSVSGVKGDEFITGNGNNWDSNWNPIWYNAAQIDDEGWTGEAKIPLSQLRFGEKEQHIWGMNVMRRDFGADERSTWQWIPQNAAGWVSNFGELHGIEGIKPKKQIEIQPYTVLSASSFSAEEGNPYSDGSEFSYNVGVDGKIGITSDLTLDFTINPDFGQVEADPSRLTLDGFQIFFDERRPFFVENSNLFSFNVSRLEAGGPFGNDNLFYSRRIGGSPRGNINVPDNAYVDYPAFTTILGSAKFSGKTKNGLSMGLLESVTAQERALINVEGVESEAIVEPLTNFIVGSISQDINKGESKVGITLTALNRDLKDTDLEDQYHSKAYSGGIDLLHSWKSREWQLKGNFIFSHVEGSETKITDTQNSFEHYFQRPDAEHLQVSEDKNSLTGHGGTFSLANYGGNDNISFQTGVTWRSPDIELNDIGFLNTADQIDHVTWVGYRSPKPVSIFRSYGVNLNQYSRWTYGGEHLYNALNTNMHFNLKNYWSFGTGLTYEMKDISTKALFGGPKLRQNKGLAPWFYINSDNRKKLNFGFNMFSFGAVGPDKGAVQVNSYDFRMSYQPNSSIRFSLSPGYFKQNRAVQNVDFYNYESEDRYITGRVKQETFYMSIRLNYSITPNMTLEYWGQPFVSKGNYSEFKYITEPLARDYEDRFALYDQQQLYYSEDISQYSLDENRDGFTDHSFSNPDFNFLQYRSNLVFRWEYKPGSELFLVWTQNNSAQGDPNRGIFPSLQQDLFSQDAFNVFLLKMTYRFY